MMTHNFKGAAWTGPRKCLALILTTLVFSLGLPAQPPPNSFPAAENILSGALVIPMDNVNQGNAGGTTFNLRAYGLANLFLQNNIPVKWAIKPGKAKDDVDFSANVTRIAGSLGPAGPASVSFSGGPFVIAREFDTQFVRDLITSFNGAGTPVTVYKTNADASIDIRYTLTHKPKIAIGPDGGNFGSGVHQAIFDAAGMSATYTSNVGDIGNQGACYTLATQAHSTNNAFINTYKNFVQSGGNLLLQCASVGTFENDANGHFQTSGAGYFLYSSNNPPANEINSNAFVFPVGSMPFNQFIGLLADQDGAVTEFSYAAGAGPINNNTVSVVNSGVNSDKFVATASRLGSGVGGVVFELGSHNYALPDATETDSALSMLNGQRMLLNAAFVPASTVCTPAPQSVVGYKSVRRINVRQGGPPVARGDTLEWTIDYLNNSQANQFDFQVRDIINELSLHLTLVPGSNVVSFVSGGAVASKNVGYDGAGDDATADLLAPGAFLPVGGRIQIKVQTTIDMDTPQPYVLKNQTTARSQSILPTPSTKSDAVDATNAAIFDSNPPPAGSVPQVQNLNIIDPTVAPIAPTAGEVAVEGHVVTVDGVGIENALVTVVEAGSGQIKTVRTNSFGFFRVDELTAGNLYSIIVTHKRYRFPTEPYTLTVSDDVTGLTFTGRVSNTKGGGRAEEISAIKPGR